MQNYTSSPWPHNSFSKIEFNGNILSIGDYTFCSCFRLTSITIPSTVKTIGEHAFCDCSGLTSVTISYGVKTIGSEAFHDCTALINLIIPTSVITIGDGAFYSCTELTNVTILGNTFIKDYSFKGCSKLKTFYYNGTIVQDYNSFLDCDHLRFVSVTNDYNSDKFNKKPVRKLYQYISFPKYKQKQIKSN